MDDLDPDLEGWMEDVLKDAVSTIERRTPRLSGTLADSFQLNKTDDNNYSIENDVEYFPYVEFGTSKMAGRYMVRTTIEELPAIAERTEIRWKK